jgi:hypothetical protein
MKPAAKIGLVVGGYVAALLLAYMAVAIYIAVASRPDAQASGGMYAFGDMLLFLGAFGVAALVPTGAALFFLRPYRLFWDVISGLGLIISLTGLCAAVLYAFGRQMATPSHVATWVSLSVLRLLAAPMLALAFLVGAAMSAYRIPRLIFLAAAAMEGLVTLYWTIVWFIPSHFNRY